MTVKLARMLVATAMIAVGGCGPGGAAELPVLNLQATVGGFNGAATVVAAGDSVWVLDHSAATLVRIDPTTNQATSTIALGSGYANGLGLAGGRLWTFHQTAGEVVAVDPTTAKVVETVKLGQDGDWFFVGDDSAWLITEGTLARIDGATADVSSQPVDPTCDIAGVAAGAGFVWLASGDGGLCKIDEETGAVVARTAEAGAGGGIAIVDGAPWVTSADSGLAILDAATLAVATTVPAPAAGTFQGSTYSLGQAGGENTVVMGNADGESGWLRYTGATIGRVSLAGDPLIVLYAGLPANSLAGGVAEAFGSLWVTNFGAGSVERYELPTP